MRIINLIFLCLISTGCTANRSPKNTANSTQNPIVLTEDPNAKQDLQKIKGATPREADSQKISKLRFGPEWEVVSEEQERVRKVMLVLERLACDHGEAIVNAFSAAHLIEKNNTPNIPGEKQRIDRVCFELYNDLIFPDPENYDWAFARGLARNRYTDQDNARFAKKLQPRMDLLLTELKKYPLTQDEINYAIHLETNSGHNQAWTTTEFWHLVDHLGGIKEFSDITGYKLAEKSADSFCKALRFSNNVHPHVKYILGGDSESYFANTVGSSTKHQCALVYDIENIDLPNEIKSEFKIYDSKFVIGIGKDPGTIEMQTTPISSQALKFLSPILEETLFKNIDGHTYIVAPDGAGHVHMGLESISNGTWKDYSLQLRFMRDFYNHESCFRGIYHDTNARYIQDYGLTMVSSVEAILRESDPKQNQLLTVFTKLHWNALNISGIGTLEIRSLPALNHALDYATLYSIFESRLRYLDQNPNEGVTLNSHAYFKRDVYHEDPLKVCENYIPEGELKPEQMRLITHLLKTGPAPK